MIRFVSLFAGIGGFDLGLERAGLTPAGMCEIDPAARSVLERHWPDVPKHDDVTTLRAETFGPAEVVTFGSPCQDLSTAGNRAGLAGDRSGLFIEAVRYVRDMQEATNGEFPRCAVWENVTGALGSNGGRDFAAVLTLLVGGEIRRPADGWPAAGVAFGEHGSAEWRVLDSQHFGLAQRRRRVFLVHRPRGRRAGEVLLAPGILPLSDRESRQERPQGAGGAAPGADREGQDDLIAFDETLLPKPNARTRIEAGRPAPTLTATGRVSVAFAPKWITNGNGAAPSTEATGFAPSYLARGFGPRPGIVSGTLTAPAQGGRNDSMPHVATGYGVRRLTPRECERLQGFPDDWTRYRADGAEIADTPRYRMVGNAVSVPVAEWLGRRLAAVIEAHGTEAKAA